MERIGNEMGNKSTRSLIMEMGGWGGGVVTITTKYFSSPLSGGTI